MKSLIDKKTQKEFDETIYEILVLKPSERKQVENGLSELQEIRRGSNLKGAPLIRSV